MFGRSNLKKFYLIIQVNPFRVHSIDENFFASATTTFYSFFFSYRFKDSFELLVIDELFAIVFGCETATIKTFSVLCYSCAERGCYADIQHRIVHTTHDVNPTFFLAFD